ncbi:ABC-2 type transport system permease protein [Zhouia amylolytica]|uniref:ABC-2 type transport system permease protein n=1 Tax=Zhouia amylolytica TaxID=376730 RepID=A0A1I6TBY7_9FLAO|nr:gliding motility-associated ABC transporter permease subunit GldF [Zhouia amylolytica]SFS86700.1 ABC-2 type transport system permease protein [Zhouia amylolytica]
MTAILKREIKSFFASPIAYLVIGVFLLLNALFLWVFKGNFNIFDNGFADLNSFFQLAPWILIFLIPAITMKSFADEKKLGTLELLLTKPLSSLEIVLGKYFAALLLAVIALIPTILYVITIWQLGNPVGNLDMGSTLGSYFGLLFLIASYTAVGTFASTLSSNQIVAFIVAVFISFFLYYGFEGISNLFGSIAYFISGFGMKAHFDSISRGVIDLRDIIYFLSVCTLFIVLTSLRITNK